MSQAPALPFLPPVAHSGCSVLMLDTEGLDAPHVIPRSSLDSRLIASPQQVDQSYNWALSTVVVLISSLFLYQVILPFHPPCLMRCMCLD